MSGHIVGAFFLVSRDLSEIVFRNCPLVGCIRGSIGQRSRLFCFLFLFQVCLMAFNYAENGSLRLGDIFQYVLAHFWNFQMFDQIWILRPLCITEIVYKLEEHETISNILVL